MTWDVTSPLDTAQANTIHTAIQNTRAMIGERMALEVETIGTKQHNANDSEDAGKHRASELTYLLYAADADALETLMESSVYPTGTLGVARDTDVLYGKNAASSIVVVAGDHGAVSGLGDDDHEQYLLVDGSRAMTGDLDMDALFPAELTVSSFSDLPESGSISGAAHRPATWSGGHGADSLDQRHFVGAVIITYIPFSKLDVTTVSRSTDDPEPLTSYTAGFQDFPAFRGGTVASRLALDVDNNQLVFSESVSRRVRGWAFRS